MTLTIVVNVQAVAFTRLNVFNVGIVVMVHWDDLKGLGVAVMPGCEQTIASVAIGEATRAKGPPKLGVLEESHGDI